LTAGRLAAGQEKKRRQNSHDKRDDGFHGHLPPRGIVLPPKISIKSSFSNVESSYQSMRPVFFPHGIPFTVLEKVESFQSSTVLFDRWVLYD
jgi:hypothetical protein